MKKTVWYRNAMVLSANINRIAAVLCMIVCAGHFDIFADKLEIYATRYKLERHTDDYAPQRVETGSHDQKMIVHATKRASNVENSCEILCHFDVSGIPTDNVIERVDIIYNMYTSGFNHVSIYKNTRDWSWDPGISPVYSDLTFTEWPEGDRIIYDYQGPKFSAGIIREFLDNQDLKQIVQSWVTDIPTNKGLIFANDATTFEPSIFVEIWDVKLVVYYYHPSNSGPIASNVAITGSAVVGDILTANYTYSDPEGDLEEGTTFLWYKLAGISKSVIHVRTGQYTTEPATDQTYTVQSYDEGALISVVVTPGAQTGKNFGQPVESPYTGVVGGATQIDAESDEPNYIQTTILTDDADQKEIIQKEFFDGLGKKIQTQVQLNDNPDNSLITGMYYDGTDKEYISVLPFVYASKTSYLPMNGYSFIGGAKSYAQNYYNGTGGRPDAEGFPYSQVIRYSDPLNRNKLSGAPGLPFSLIQDQGHPVQMWYIGINSIIEDIPYTVTLSNGESVTIDFEKGFIKSDDLSIENLDNMQNNPMPNSNYFLTVTRGPNSGVYTQGITDKFGNVIKKWSDPNLEAGDEIISENEYDLRGNVIKEIPPLHDGHLYPESHVDPNIYTYDILGQLIEKSSPDAGTVKMKYDKAGRLKYQETQKQRDGHSGSRDPFFVYTYDTFGRAVTTAVLDHASAPEFENITDETDLSDLTVCESGDCYYFVKTRTIYDNPAYAVQYICAPGVTNQALLDLFSTPSPLQNTKARVVATITYCEECEGTPETDCVEKVIEAFSYDQEGRVIKKYKYLPEMPLHITTYEYDLQGKIKTATITNGTKTIVTKNIYDTQGRLTEVKRGDNTSQETFATYTYNDLGQVTKKTFGSTNTKDIDYTYNIRGWTKSIDAGASAFQEDLKYNDALVNPQYNGNIAQLAINQNTAFHKTLDIAYSYDNTNRLIAAYNNIPGHTEIADDEFDAHFDYDRNGRIRYKYEGYIPDPNNPGQFIQKPTTGTYNYYGYTNRLSHLEGSSTKDEVDDGSGGTSPNFIYDANGNMVLDRSKKMAVQYDWRDMPVLFSFYENIDPAVKTDADVAALGDTRRISHVKMIYDSGGNRIAKKVFKD